MAERRPRPAGTGSDARTAAAGQARRGASPAELARRAAAELAELVGREPEGIVSVERTETGWSVGVEVVETRRIPDTADILAEYAVETDDRGQMTGYRRVSRHTRGHTQDAP